MIFQLCFVVCWLSVLGAEERWVWGDNRGRDGLRGEHSVARPLVNGNVASASTSVPLFQSANKNNNVLSDEQSGRYEVFESGNGPGPNELPNRPPPRPPTQYPRPQGAGPQYPVRPPPPPPLGQRPLPPRPPGPVGPPPPDKPVLTGPVPSWERPPPPKNNDPTSFDTCKCVNSFNCKSPGLKFGSCDVGKFYCCYNNPGFGVYSSGGIGVYGEKGGGTPILAGPGGPIDNLRPDFLRPPGPPPPDGPFFNRPPPPGLGNVPYDEIDPRNGNGRRGKSKNV